MVAGRTTDSLMAGLSTSMGHSHDDPYSNDLDNHDSTQAQPKTWLLCPYFYLDHHKHGHCLGLNLFRQGDLEQHLARCHVFQCRRCEKPFVSAFLLDQHMENKTSCVPNEEDRSNTAIEKTLKIDLKYHRKGDDQDQRLINLCKYLFNWTQPYVMQFLFPPILLLIYYAVSAIVLSLLWASLLGLVNESHHGLSSKFIYEIFMACTSDDLRTVEMLIQLAMKLASIQSSEEGLEVSLEGMLQKLFRISGTNLEDAVAHGDMPSSFEVLGDYSARQVHGVLCDNPQQLSPIISYLRSFAVVQSNNDIPYNPYSQQAEQDASMSDPSLPSIFPDIIDYEPTPRLGETPETNHDDYNYDSSGYLSEWMHDYYDSGLYSEGYDFYSEQSSPSL